MKVSVGSIFRLLLALGVILQILVWKKLIPISFLSKPHYEIINDLETYFILPVILLGLSCIYFIYELIKGIEQSLIWMC